MWYLLSLSVKAIIRDQIRCLVLESGWALCWFSYYSISSMFVTQWSVHECNYVQCMIQIELIISVVWY